MLIKLENSSEFLKRRKFQKTLKNKKRRLRVIKRGQTCLFECLGLRRPQKLNKLSLSALLLCVYVNEKRANNFN
jgi:hypothetical protein